MNITAHTDLLTELRGPADFWDRPDGNWGAADDATSLPAAAPEDRQDANSAYRMGAKALRRDDLLAARRWFTLACSHEHPGAAFRSILTGENAAGKNRVLISVATGAGKTHVMLQVLQQVALAARWGHGDARHLTVSLITPTRQPLEAFLRDIRNRTAHDTVLEQVTLDRDVDYVAEDTEFYPRVRGLLEDILPYTQTTTADAELPEPSLRTRNRETAGMTQSRGATPFHAPHEQDSALLYPSRAGATALPRQALELRRDELLAQLCLEWFDQAYSARPGAASGGWWRRDGLARSEAGTQRYSRLARARQRQIFEAPERYRTLSMTWFCRCPDCAEGTMLRAPADSTAGRCPRCGAVQQPFLLRELLSGDRPARHGSDDPLESDLAGGLHADLHPPHSYVARQYWHSLARWNAARAPAELSLSLLVWVDLPTSTALAAAARRDVLEQSASRHMHANQCRTRTSGESAVGGALRPWRLPGEEELVHLSQWAPHASTRMPGDGGDILLATSMISVGIDVSQLVPVHVMADRRTHVVRDDTDRLYMFAPAPAQANPDPDQTPRLLTPTHLRIQPACDIGDLTPPPQKHDSGPVEGRALYRKQLRMLKYSVAVCCPRHDNGLS
ncbi:hypothetical protein ACFYXW_12335 [Streptomyces sp. NPDC001981]|uniref:hypothetical protein n=1 Tax=Streptomyces sp. NPDC001981 TaxID=3364628 RepID=UPI0036CD9AC4